MKINETLHVENRDEWRAWLQKNHAGKKEIWLLFFKGRPARKQVSYGAAVEEALCFGWIDSNIQKIDDEKYGRKFTPRKKGSNWSALNKRRVAALIREGRMTEAGLAALSFKDDAHDYGRNDGTRERDLVPPAFLVRRLRPNRQAWKNFQAMAPSYRRRYIGWISAAKTEETRDRRIREAIDLLSRNEKLGMK